MIKKAVVFIFIDIERKKVLLERRSQNQYLSSYKLFPGGKVEENEAKDLTVTLRREIKEELGITKFKYHDLRKRIKELNGYWLYPYIVYNWSGFLPIKSIDKKNRLEWMAVDEFKPTLRPVKKMKTLVKKFLMSHNVIDRLPHLVLTLF